MYIAISRGSMCASPFWSTHQPASSSGSSLSHLSGSRLLALRIKCILNIKGTTTTTTKATRWRYNTRGLSDVKSTFFSLSLSLTLTELPLVILAPVNGTSSLGSLDFVVWRSRHYHRLFRSILLLSLLLLLLLLLLIDIHLAWLN